MKHSGKVNLYVLVRLAAFVVAVAIIGRSAFGPGAGRGRPALSAPAAAPAGDPRPAALSQPVRVGRLTDPGLTESSGIVASRKYPGVYWTMNDSGHPPVLYAVDAAGKGLYHARLTAARNIDWEDIAIDAAGRLYVGDFGNNSRRRKVLTIYAVTEPDPRAAPKAVGVKGVCRFRYPDGHGPFDCEAMFVRKGWAYLITKELPTARLYRVRLAGGQGKIVRAEYLGLMPKAQWVTAADICPAGRRIAVLSYIGVWVYQLDRPLEEAVAAAGPTSQPATQPATASRPVQVVRAKPIRRGVRLRQAEAICWEQGPSPKALLITNEQREVYRMELTGAPASRPTPTR